jgi:iron(III) transport system ATP-binding protein
MSQVVLQNVSKSYGAVAVVKDLTFTIQDGEFVSFLGPSGCGKTTSLRIIAGLERNDSGVVMIGDKVVSAPAEGIFVPPEKRHAGMVFQSYAIWPHMNVFENVAFPLKIAKVSKAAIRERVMETLRLVNMGDLAERRPNQLSGGQQQRIALARGLVMAPDVLLLDEPLSNLDAKLREKMRHDIRRIQQDLRITVVYVTHDQLEATSMSDRMLIMDQGKVIQVGTPREIKENPINQFVADFIR